VSLDERPERGLIAILRLRDSRGVVRMHLRA
jgi:hypothetical protein